MNRDRQNGKELDRRQIDQAIASLAEAGGVCHEKDVRYGMGVFAALSFLERHADEQWPFEQFRDALADAGMDGTKPEARWQVFKCCGGRE